MSDTSEDIKQDDKENDLSILHMQIAMIDNLKENTNVSEENTSEENNIEIAKDDTSEKDLTNVDTNLETKVITENNITASFTDSKDDIQVKNQSKYDVNDLLANGSYTVQNKDKVIIYHTHTCESYTPSEKYNYNMTGAYRTTDLNFTVARVGDELENALKQYGKTVVHDKTYHDYPSYNGSYDRSVKTLTNILNDNPDGEIAIDLHRDAVRKF